MLTQQFVTIPVKTMWSLVDEFSSVAVSSQKNIKLLRKLW